MINESTSSSAAKSSPKRKRSTIFAADSPAKAPRLRTNTRASPSPTKLKELSPALESPGAGASPRSAVATSFKALDLEPDSGKRLFGRPADHGSQMAGSSAGSAPHERAEVDLSAEDNLAGQELSSSSKNIVVIDPALCESAENSNSVPDSDQPSLTQKGASAVPSTPIFSPSLPATIPLSLPTSNLSKSIPSSSRSSVSLPSDSALFYWQDHEITGHTPETDDDLEGLNGIGFKPTPAMAYARSQKRKQQVQLYKSREASEARQRRSERRRREVVRRGVGDTGAEIGNEERRVRFVVGEG